MMAINIIFEVIDNIRTHVSEILQRHYPDLKSSHFPMKKKMRHLKDGDIVVPQGFYYKLRTEDDCPKLDDKEILEMVQERIRDHRLPIQRVTQDAHNLLKFYMNRALIFQSVIKQVKDTGKTYGHVADDLGPVHICPMGINKENHTLSLNDLRMMVIFCHLRKILQANGYKVVSLNQQSENITNIINNLVSGLEMDTCSECTDDSQNCQQRFMDKAKEYANDENNDIWIEGQTRDDVCKGESGGKFIEANLRGIIAQKQLLTGRYGYDSNLNVVEVLSDGEASIALKEAAALENNLQESPDHIHCLHLALQPKSFQQQQALLLWSALSTKVASQSMLVVGPVLCKTEADASGPAIMAQDLCISRYKQMQEASEMRYGGAEGEEEKERIELLTSASLRVDMLSNAAQSPLHLEMAQSSGAESRFGAFVMYNTARLATLFDRFQEQVHKGVYPPLPPVDDVDFSLLREEEEWELLYLYISEFPSLIRQAVELVLPQDGGLMARIHTHKVCGFLVSFSKCLSSYYSRYHILGGGEKHLHPLMFARLHLMQAAHSVMVSCLDLLDVKALAHL